MSTLIGLCLLLES